MRLVKRTARTVLLLLVLLPVGVLVACLAFRLAEPPVTALQAIRLVQGYGFERQVLTLDAMGPHLPRAVIASEDNLFCRHGGIDWQAFGEQLELLFDGGRPRGASTVTMQLTKNLFLWPDRSSFRKALELTLAPLVDLALPKRRQLEIYLNQVELGPGIYGVESGARAWFGKGAAQLSAREAATLVALLPGPLHLEPGDARVQAQVRRIRTRKSQLGPLLDCAG